MHFNDVEVYSQTFNLVGVSFRTLPIEKREAFAKIDSIPQNLLSAFVSRCSLQEAAIVSTCNRFEIISVGKDRESDILGFILDDLKLQVDRANIYSYRNAQAIRHFFRVACSIDSMVLGETQILGQIKDAYYNSVRAGFAGKHLHHLFQFAFRLAKKARNSTQICDSGISVSYIAVKLAEQIFGDLSGRKVLLIGSGRVGELTAIHLKSHGCSNIVVANRTVERAAELASVIGGSAISLDDINSQLNDVDVVVGSIIAEEPVLTREMLTKLSRRSSIFLIDLGVPRNFEASVGEIDGVYLYNIDDLSAISDRNLSVRTEAMKDVEIIIDHGLMLFERWLNRLTVEPKYVDFRAHVRKICEQEIQRIAPRLESRIEVERISEALSHRISEKISYHLADSIFSELEE